MKTTKLPPHSKFENEFSGYLKQISHRLKQLRESRNLTVIGVAEKLQLHPATIIEVEDGSYDFDVDLLIVLCELYGVNMEDVINLE
jgi:DNA-binding XRE family transcriptional regulator